MEQLAAGNAVKKLLSTPKKKQEHVKTLAAECKGRLCYAFDFGEFAVKIAVARINRNSIEVRDLILVENDERSARIEASNLKEWRAKIQRALNQHGLNPSGQIAMCTVGSRNYISRQLEIPYAAEADRQGLVAYEMSQSLSLDMDAYLFQHKVNRVYESGGVKMCSVWVAAVSKALCENYYHLLESLRLKPLAMDIHVNGLERLLAADHAMHAATQDHTAVFVDYGIRSTEISIFDRGGYLQGINLDSGESRLVSAAKNALGVQIADIHNGNKLIVPPQKIYDIMRQPQANENSAVFADVVEKWLGEVGAVVKRYNIDHTASPITAMYLYGGSLQFPWLKAYLEKYLGVKTTVLSALDCVTLSSRIQQSGNTVPQFLNAMDLFLRS